MILLVVSCKYSNKIRILEKNMWLSKYQNNYIFVICRHKLRFIKNTYYYKTVQLTETVIRWCNK